MKFNQSQYTFNNKILKRKIPIHIILVEMSHVSILHHHVYYYYNSLIMLYKIYLLP